MKDKLSRFDYEQYQNTGIASAANFHRFFGGFCLILAVVLLIVAINFYSTYKETAILIPFGIFIVINLLFGIRSLSKVKPLTEQAEDMKLKSEQKRHRLKSEIDELGVEINNLTDSIKLRKIQVEEIRDKYMKHMVNQQDLLDKEISAIHPMPSTENDTKECPQCAETIKAKAKVCRFCNYRFD